MHVQLLAPRSKYLWLYTEENITVFRDSYATLCGVEKEPDITVTEPSGREPEDQLPLLLSKGNMSTESHEYNPFYNRPHRRALVASAALGVKYRLLLYQRDEGRLILNAEEVLVTIRKGLSPERWEVKQLVHDDSRQPCELIKEINAATVLLSTHGFQSTLLLYQPRHSVLAEIHTSMMYIPQFYGELQLSLRQAFGFAR